ncbi:NAD-dependent deacetylase [Strigomonas culicis]|uniref:NAD-dependent protein deacylase n=1 Tax=Strigomonas culicis TaxID=28005 RepID=S9UMF8_9TRYP|nr:NAD-dependent deacetylase [Strigomonas culicis]EPY35938.1 NAD-dependent deacetylase [Strigomonas culicis]|eukprot:EPY29929.1 NAD-dependent deacetylase [Strigomonas culicis]
MEVRIITVMNKLRYITILTGAGISAESGIPTFRDANGLWHNHRVEEVASYDAFRRHPELVQRFYNERRRGVLQDGIRPNAAHAALARLQRAFAGRVTLVTQNVDDLHERAGSTGVLHMHGELLKARCDRTGAVYEWTRDIRRDEDRCQCCGTLGTLRPHIVWFGEMPFYMDDISASLAETDLFVAIGTSGVVYPAAGFVQEAQQCGARTLELNLEKGENVSSFHRSIYGKATETVPAWVASVLDGTYE